MLRNLREGCHRSYALTAMGHGPAPGPIFAAGPLGVAEQHEPLVTEVGRLLAGVEQHAGADQAAVARDAGEAAFGGCNEVRGTQHFSERRTSTSQ